MNPHEAILASINQNSDYTPYARLLTRLNLDPLVSKGGKKLIVLLMMFYRKIKVGYPSISELADETSYTEKHIRKLLSQPGTKRWVERQSDGSFVFSFPTSELMD